MYEGVLLCMSYGVIVRVPFFMRKRIEWLYARVNHIKGFEGVVVRLLSMVIVFSDEETALRVRQMLVDEDIWCTNYIEIGVLGERE